MVPTGHQIERQPASVNSGCAVTKQFPESAGAMAVGVRGKNRQNDRPRKGGATSALRVPE